MQFSNYTQTVVGLALLTIGLVALAAIGGAATTEMANESVTFENDSNVTVSVDWNDSAPSDGTADVTFYEESAYQIDGDDVTDSHLNATTLSGTTAEFDSGNVTSGSSYDVELDSSATTVTVQAADIADDGTVDLSTHSDSSITADDTILSVTATADTVVSDSITADPGNTTETEFVESDGLEDGIEYRVVVSADDTEATDVTVSAGGFLGGIWTGVDGSPGFGAGVAFVAIAAVALIARRES